VKGIILRVSTVRYAIVTPIEIGIIFESPLRASIANVTAIIGVCEHELRNDAMPTMAIIT